MPSNDDTMAGFNKSWVVVIGVTKYPGARELVTAVDDAREVGRLLQELHGFEKPIERFEEQATVESLQSLFDGGLQERVGPDDRLVVYYAGHGEAGVADSTGSDVAEGYFTPYSVSGTERLRMRDVRRGLEKLDCRHWLLVLDCCYAGQFRSRAGPTQGMLYKERFEYYFQHKSWYSIGSCGANQRALEAEGEKFSPFAQALHAALGGKADSNGDGLITVTEMHQFIDDWLSNYFAKKGLRQAQNPFLSREKGEGEFFFFTPGKELALKAAPPLDPKDNPYLGLHSYNLVHAEQRLFFGRTRIIAELKSTVQKQNLTAVVGGWGTGKSSLVKAGLAYALKREPNWRVLPPIVPGADPVGVLRTALQDVGSQQQVLLIIDQFEEVITLAPHSARETFVKELQALRGRRWVHVVCTLRSDYLPRFRSDLPELEEAAFQIQPMGLSELEEVIEGPAALKGVIVPPDLSMTLLSEVGDLPGALPLLSFALNYLYADLVNRTVANPATERALQLPADDKGGKMGVATFIRRRADAVLKSGDVGQGPDPQWDDAAKETMSRLFLRMISIEGGLARSPVTSADLAYPDAAETERASFVLGRLREAGLVVLEQDAAGRESYKPAHDYLLNSWAQLQTWLDEVKGENFNLFRKLTQQTRDWQSAAEDQRPGYLWTGDPRFQMVEKLGLGPEGKGPLRRLLLPNERELQFLTATRDEIARRRSAETRSATVRRRWGIGSIVVLALALLASAGYGISANLTNHEAQRRVGLQQVAQGDLSGLLRMGQAAGDTGLARLGSLLGWWPSAAHAFGILDVSCQLRLASAPRLVTYFNGIGSNQPADPIGDCAAVSADGTLLVSAWKSGENAYGGTLWSLAGEPAKVFDLPEQGMIYRFDISADGRRFLAISENGKGYYWEQGGQLQKFSVDGNCKDVVFSPNGKFYLTRYGDVGDTHVELNSWPSTVVRTLPGNPVGRPAFASDGSRCAYVCNPDGAIPYLKVVALEDLGDGEVIPFPVKAGYLVSGDRGCCFSEDGSRLVGWIGTQRPEGGAFVYERQGSKWERLSSYERVGGVASAALSSDGMRLVISSSDGSARVYGVGQVDCPVSTALQHGDSVTLVGFLWGSEVVLTADRDGMVRLFLEKGKPLMEPLPHDEAVSKVVAFPEKSQLKLVTVTLSGRVRVWMLPIADYSHWLQGHCSSGLPLAWNDKGLLYRSTRGGNVAAINAEGAEIGRCQLTSDIAAMAVHPDGGDALLADKSGQLCRWLPPASPRPVQDVDGVISVDQKGDVQVAGTRDGRVLLWKGSTEAKTLEEGKHSIFLLQLSPDGKRLVVADTDWEARLWNLEVDPPQSTSLPHKGFVSAARFNPSGSVLATGSWDGLLRLWNAADGKALQDPVPANADQQERSRSVYTLAWSPDGKSLASCQYYSPIRIWQMGDGTAHLDSTRSFSMDAERGVTGLAWSPSGEYLLAASPRGLVAVYEAEEEVAKPLRRFLPDFPGLIWALVAGAPGVDCVQCASLRPTEARAWIGGETSPAGFQPIPESGFAEAISKLKAHASSCRAGNNNWREAQGKSEPEALKSAATTSGVLGQSPKARSRAKAAGEFDERGWDKWLHHESGTRPFIFVNNSARDIEVTFHFWPGQITAYTASAKSRVWLGPWGYSGGWGVSIGKDVRSIREVSDINSEGYWELNEEAFYR